MRVGVVDVHLKVLELVILRELYELLHSFIVLLLLTWIKEGDSLVGRF